MDDTQPAMRALKPWMSILGEPSLAPISGVDSPLWRVHNGDGAEFVIKRLPDYPPGVGPVDGYRVATYLYGAGVPVVLPVVTDAGTILAPVDGDSYVLLPYVPTDAANHELEPNAATTAYAIGAAIGKLDRALADCPWPVKSFVDDPVPQTLDRALPELPPEVTAPVAPLVDHLREEASNLPTQRTHGDCNSGNVLVHQGRVAGFIDLDHLPIGPRVRDLSYYLSGRLCAHLNAGAAATRDTAAMLAVLNQYVAGYHASNPLSDAELRAVVPLILLVTIGMAHWCVHSRVPNPELYEQNVRAIEWITRHFEELTAAASPPA